MQPVLVIDTCGGDGYVGLCLPTPPDARVLAERRLSPRATQEELLPAIAAVLAQAGCSLAEVAAVAVVNGPGSFTGVRIGLATAKGLCEAHGLSLVALSRLQVLALAWRVQSHADEDVWAWLDAGRGDVYAARVSAGQHGAELESMLPLESAAVLAGESAVALYEQRLAASFPGGTRVCHEAYETALRHAAVRALQQGNLADVALTDALYLRIPDAELALRARQV